jgi:ubiquitin
MTNVTSKEAIVLAYLARHKDISESEWQELSDTLEGDARDLAEKLREARVEEEKVKLEEAKAKAEAAKKSKAPESDSKRGLARPKTKSVAVQSRSPVRRQKALASA